MDDDRDERGKEDFKRKFRAKERKHKEASAAPGEKPLRLIPRKPDRSRIHYDPDDEFQEWGDE